MKVKKESLVLVEERKRDWIDDWMIKVGVELCSSVSCVDCDD
jgi:hypothetical protein